MGAYISQRSSQKYNHFWPKVCLGNICKAWFVVQVHKNTMESSLVHNISVARQHFTRIVVSLAVIFQFHIFSIDFTQAYLQSKKNFNETYIWNPIMNLDSTMRNCWTSWCLSMDDQKPVTIGDAHYVSIFKQTCTWISAFLILHCSI